MEGKDRKKGDARTRKGDEATKLLPKEPKKVRAVAGADFL
jgi:hypothetical protein